MTSKNLYFKLMKEDLKSRLWAVSLIGLGFFFLYPVAVAFMAGDIKEYRVYEEGIVWFVNQAVSWLSFGNGMTVFVMILTSLICGLSGFSYLNSKSKVDFYHSIPVKREKLYLANYINGILIVAVPYAVCTVLAVFVGASNGVDAGMLWKTACTAYGMHMTYFILMYTVVVIAAMMTGNLVVGFLGCGVFAFSIPMLVSLIQGYFSAFFHTFSWESSQKLVESGLRLSPVMEYSYQFSRYMDGERIGIAAFAALALSAVLAVIGCILYRKRPSETAGKAMAFAVSKPIIRILLTMISALGLGLFFWSMRKSTGWAVFGILCGAVISHCVIEIIYHFDFKALFSNKLQLAGCVLVSLAVMFVFRYDVVGYDRYLPKAGDVKEAAVEISRLSEWVSYGETERRDDGSYVWEYEPSLDYKIKHMKDLDTENLLSIAATGIENSMDSDIRDKRYYQKPSPGSEIDGEQTGTYSSMVICYTLKSGRKVYRSYTVDLDRIAPQMEKLYGSAEYQKGTFPLMTMVPEDVNQIYYSESRKEIRMDKLTAEQKAVILETYQKEFAAMTPNQLKKEFPLGLIRFATVADEEGLQWLKKAERSKFKDYPGYEDTGALSNSSYYPIYPSCKETIKLLQEQQVEAGGFFRNMDIKSITVTWNAEREVIQEISSTYEGSSTYALMDRMEVLITDPAEIEQMKPLMVGTGRKYYNSLVEISDVEVEFSAMEGGVMQTYTTYFPRGEVPEFVKERLMTAKVK